MYLDHPAISATNGDTEPDRVERLNRVYGYAIALADADANGDCITKLTRLHDHKGQLIVHWAVAPNAREQDYFLRAWKSLIGDRSENVAHQLEAGI
ncbi:MAG: hypothetical protein H7244_12530 [Herminiimonas sp.]|nr:hypothetical protein [Herminiimonas sp.]